MMFPVTLFAAEGGFGINLNPLETNLINLVIVIGLLAVSYTHLTLPTMS